MLLIGVRLAPLLTVTPDNSGGGWGWNILFDDFLECISFLLSIGIPIFIVRQLKLKPICLIAIRLFWFKSSMK